MMQRYGRAEPEMMYGPCQQQHSNFEAGASWIDIDAHIRIRVVRNSKEINKSMMKYLHY